MNISIVTIVLNDKNGFIKTANSIAEQTSKDYEWIVIDGESIDGTTKKVETYLKYITEFVSEADSGIYDAMNKGIRLCNGRYIIFMNAGDAFADDSTLEVINNYICQDDNIDVILGGTLQNFNGVMVYRPPKKMSWIKKGLPAFHQSTFYRTSFLKKRAFNLDCKLLADYEMLAYMMSGVNVIIMFSINALKISDSVFRGG